MVGDILVWTSLHIYDKLVERVSRPLQELAHAPIENEAPIQEEPTQPKEPIELEAPTQGTEQVTVELINSSDIESDCGGDMVTPQTMTVDHFVPETR